MDPHATQTILRWLYTTISCWLVYAFVNRARQYRRLRHFAGPRTTGWSWWWHSRAVLSREAHQWYAYATDQYGPIARVAPNLLMTSDPDLWAHINAVRSPYKRAEWYYHAARFEPGKDNVFTECDSEKHDARRKKVAAGYSGKENPTLETTVDTHVKELIHLIRTKHASPASSNQASQPMDMSTKIQYFTLDVISSLGLGKPIGDLKANEDVYDYLESLAIGLQIGNVAFGLGTSWLPRLPIIGPALSPSEKDTTGFGRMIAEARKIIEERKTQSTQEKSDMIASFIRNGVSGDELFQEVFEPLLAGSDTTSAAIRIIMLYLMTHPRVLTKLRAEIDESVKTGSAPISSDIISDVEARRLPYLSAVVREGMRVHPPVVNLFPRVAPLAGDTVTVQNKQYHIPGGTLVGYSAFGMHRSNTALYGPDAHVFRPERWFLDETVPEGKERLARMKKGNDMVFGYGRWVCLGRNIALMEIHKVVYELVRRFDFGVVRAERPWVASETLGLWDISDMWVQVTGRD